MRLFLEAVRALPQAWISDDTRVFRIGTKPDDGIMAVNIKLSGSGVKYMRKNPGWRQVGKK